MTEGERERERERERESACVCVVVVPLIHAADLTNPELTILVEVLTASSPLNNPYMH
jgi:hypothetical protein